MAVNQVIICVNILVGEYGNLAGISAGSVALNSAYRVTAIDKVKFLCAMLNVKGNTGDFYIAEQILEGAIVVRLGRRSAGVGSIVFFPNGVKGGILAYCYAIAANKLCGRSIFIGAPALKGIVFSGGLLSAYCKGGTLALFYPLCFRRGCICTAVCIISEGNVLETHRIIAQIQGERVRRISGMRRSGSSPCAGSVAHISLIYVSC